jgi:crotonobetainyl-CoA:carnitine CoA-transferase CaiB-like acyl-CoA transferase
MIPTRDELVWIVLGVVIASAVMAALHEKHYNGRRERVEAGRELGLLAALELRVRTVEEILLEDRET